MPPLSRYCPVPHLRVSIEGGKPQPWPLFIDSNPAQEPFGLLTRWSPRGGVWLCQAKDRVDLRHKVVISRLAGAQTGLRVRSRAAPANAVHRVGSYSRAPELQFRCGGVDAGKQDPGLELGRWVGDGGDDALEALPGDHERLDLQLLRWQ